MEKLNSFLRLAAISGVAAAVKLHIKRGDDINARDRNGLTPLMLAAARNTIGVVNLLLEAGANPELVDPKGQDAFAHASKAGCPDVAAILLDAIERTPVIRNTSSGIIDACRLQNREKINHKEKMFLPMVAETSGILPLISQSDASQIIPPLSLTNETAKSLSPPFIDRTQAPNTTIMDLDNAPLEPEFESGWEAEIVPVPPEGNNSVVEAAFRIVATIGKHKIVDRYEDWADVDLDLPERATPLKRTEDDVVIFQLLLAALRDGIVSEESLAKACLLADGSVNEQEMRLLALVVGEVGAIVAEWDGDEVPNMEEPSQEEERLINDALVFAQELASGHNEPFRFYSRDMRGSLLDAEEERALGREMEKAGLAALAALAQWPEGLSILFDTADQVARGEADAELFTAGPEPSSEDMPTARRDIADDDDSELDEVASFFVTAVEAIRTAKGDIQRMTQALTEARLTRGFLIKLADRAERNQTGIDFSGALGRQSAARERMILGNLRLALHIAKKHLWSGFPIDDLIQEANIGLMKAAERYDWSKGFRFSTYATWWIRQQVTRFIADHSRTIRIPVHMVETINKMNRIRRMTQQEIGCKPTVRELSERMDIPEDRIRKLQVVDKLTTISMETPISHEEDSCLGDFFGDSHTDSPFDAAVSTNLKVATQEALSCLNSREVKIIRMRFGIDMDTNYTLEETGKFFDLTRERIRQIEAKALRKLRYPDRSEILRSFLE